jgi:hypothetical protein
MHRFVNRVFDLRLTAFAAALLLVAAPMADAAVTSYHATLTGPAESPPNASPGVGSAQVDIDPVAHTMRVQASFVGLIGNVSASHIHGPTAVAGTGTAGVMTQTPTFAGFPSGVTAGAYDNTFNTLALTSYNPTFVTNNGGTAASAETAMFAAIAAGKAYFNIHTNVFPGGEIRGFLLPLDATPTATPSWGRIKQLYR